MKHLKIQQAARENPDNTLHLANLANSLRVMLRDISGKLLRGKYKNVELREEVESVGFVAVWWQLSEVLASAYDDERHYAWHIERLARRQMEKTRDARYKPAGIGRDRRREMKRQYEQNDQEQRAGHRLSPGFRRGGGEVERRQCLNGHQSWNAASDDIRDDREQCRRVSAWRVWVAAEVQSLLLREPPWLREAVRMAMSERRFGIGDRKKPSISAIARALDAIDRRVLSAALWRLACMVAAGAPDFVMIDGVTIEPDAIGRQQLGSRWDEAAAEGAHIQLVKLLFDAAA